MLAGLDSSFATPSAAQVAQAKASGVSGWSGYLATKPNVGLAHPWTQAQFDVVLQGGLFSIAFCSGWDDPVACKNLAAAWGVKLCLDVEGGIRGDGPWVQPWLDASGAGLYGNEGVHPNRNATFHILAAYPASGNPNATWYSGYPRPAGPCGWQWWGTHTEFGATVDRGWYDDWFAQSTPIEDDDDMPTLVNTPNDGVWMLSGAMYVHVTDPPVEQSMLAAGWKTITVDEGQHQNFLAGSASNPATMLVSIPDPSINQTWLLAGGIYSHVTDSSTLASLAATGMKSFTATPAQHAALLAAANSAPTTTGTLNVNGTLQVTQ